MVVTIIIPDNQDIFYSPAEVLVNTVNCASVMGAGLAAQFKKYFPDYFQSYKLACHDGVVKTDGSSLHSYMYLKEAEYPTYDLGRHIRDYATGYIISFPTKGHWKYPSKIEYIDNGMRSLCKWIESETIRGIAIPPLGCGLGGLKWEIVEPLIMMHLRKIEQDLVVYLYPPPEKISSYKERKWSLES